MVEVKKILRQDKNNNKKLVSFKENGTITYLVVRGNLVLFNSNLLKEASKYYNFYA